MEITADRALELARQFLGENWINLKPADIKVIVCGGGYCSRLYIIENLRGNTKYKKFLIRLYGGKVLEENTHPPMVTLNLESQVLLFHHHGYLGLGPKLLGSFEGGRLEQFLPSHAPTEQEMLDPEVQAHFARKLARYHNINLPLDLEQLDHYRVVEYWYKQFDSEEGKKWFLNACQMAQTESTWGLQFDWKAEIAWLKATEPKVQTRMVLCTNDMNRMNVLVLEEPDERNERVKVIDYELSSMNSRGLDLGHHFAMWLADYSAKSGAFVSTLDYPNESIRRNYIEHYMDETRKAVDFELDPVVDSVDHVLMESEFFGLKVMHFWIAHGIFPRPDWTMLGAKPAVIGFLGTAKRMVENYNQLKERFRDKYKL